MPRFFTFLLFLSLAMGVLSLEEQTSALVAGDSLGKSADSSLAAEGKEPDKKIEAANSDAKQQADGESDDKEEPADKNGDKNTDEKSDEKSDEKTNEEEKGGKSEQDKKSEKKASDDSKPTQVKRKPHKVEAELDGIFVADQMEEVSLRPEVWTKFKVLEAVKHGTRVKKGDLLVRFDPEDLEKKIAEESVDQRLSELKLMQQEEEYPRAKRLLELNFEEAQRSNERVKEDYETYHSIDRPFTVRIAHYRYKSALEDLASQQEELAQLKKMYEADELTEDTEAIVLRRQEFQVATAELVLELEVSSRDYTLNVLLPRRDQAYKTMLEDAEIAYEQAKTAKEVGLPRKAFEMEKLREARAKSVEQHAKLVSDKGLMEIRAPVDGAVYYGKCSDGKWSQVTSLTAKLRPFASASANSVLMTIVQQRPLHVEAKISEKELPDLKQGQITSIVPSADKERHFSGKVLEIASIPGASSKYTVQLEFDPSDIPDWLVAGMTCDALVTVYENKQALVIPTDLVQTDEDDGKIKYVMLVDSDEDEPVRREVKLGRKKGSLVEVLKGLDEGDEIVKEKKKADKK